jgi:RecT family
MTDTTPMVFKGRASAPAATREAMDVDILRAQWLAKAGDCLPRAYRDKPGAVMLIDQWARARNIDTLTAMQNVAFIDGKPVADATFQRALASRSGYTITFADVSRKAATAIVIYGSDEVGRATYTWEDGQLAKLTEKDNWKKNPEDMLIARATTRALKRYAPDVLLGIMTEDEIEVAPISERYATGGEVSAETPTTVMPGETFQFSAANAVESEVIEDAEIVEPEPTLEYVSEIKQTDLMAAARKAGKSTQAVMVEAERLTGDGKITLAKLCEDQEMTSELMAWINRPTDS